MTSVLTHDLSDIAEIEKLTVLPKFAQLHAEHSLARGRPISMGLSGAWEMSKSSMIKLTQATLIPQAMEHSCPEAVLLLLSFAPCL